MDAAIRCSGPGRRARMGYQRGTDLERAARQAHPVFDRQGLPREAARAIEAAKARVSPLDALAQQHHKLRWQLSQPLSKE